jgi:hypothetical protein
LAAAEPAEPCALPPGDRRRELVVAAVALLALAECVSVRACAGAITVDVVVEVGVALVSFLTVPFVTGVVAWAFAGPCAAGAGFWVTSGMAGVAWAGNVAAGAGACVSALGTCFFSAPGASGLAAWAAGATTANRRAKTAGNRDGEYTALAFTTSFGRFPH